MPVVILSAGLQVGVDSYPVKNAVVVASGDLVGLDSNGQIVLADCDAPVDALGFAVFQDGPAITTRTGDAALTQKATIRTFGAVQGAGGMSSLTIGGIVYVSATAGQYTQSAPAAGHIQPAGIAISATAVQVMPVVPVIKIQAAGNTTIAAI